MPFYNKYLKKEHPDKKDRKKNTKKIKKRRNKKIRRKSKPSKKSLFEQLFPRLKRTIDEEITNSSSKRLLKKRIQQKTPYRYDFSTRYTINGVKYSIIELKEMGIKIVSLIDLELKRIFPNSLDVAILLLKTRKKEYRKIFSLLKKIDKEKWENIRKKIARKHDEYILNRIKTEIDTLRENKFFQEGFDKKIGPLHDLSEIIEKEELKIGIKEKISVISREFSEISDPVDLLRYHLELYREKIKTQLGIEGKLLEEDPEDQDTERRLANSEAKLKTVRYLIKILSKYNSQNYVMVLNRILFSRSSPTLRRNLKPLSLFFQKFEERQFESLFQTCKKDEELLRTMSKIYEKSIKSDAAEFFNLTEILNYHLTLLRSEEYPDLQEEIEIILRYMEEHPDWLESPKDILVMFDRINPYRDPIPELKDTIFRIYKLYREEMKQFERDHQYNSAIVRGKQIIELFRRYDDIYGFGKKIHSISEDIREDEYELSKWVNSSLIFN